MIDPRVSALCAEYGIEIIDGRAYPDIRQTRAVVTMERILRSRGEPHFRMLMSTVAETQNNQGMIDQFLLWSVSDLIEACAKIVENQPSDWLEMFDAIPVGELQYIARNLKRQRSALVGMLFERVVRRFGPKAIQPDLFDDRGPYGRENSA